MLGEITATSANGGLRLSRGSALTNGAKHSFSCYIEGGDYEASFTTENSAATYGTVCGVNINPSTGAISGELGFLDVITTPYGDGYSVELRFPNESGNDTLSFEIRLPNAAVLFIGRPQFEAGATSSSHIPTAGATVTRAADTLTVPSANLPWPEPVVIGPELVTGSWATAPSYDNITSGTGTSVSSSGVTTVSRSFINLSGLTVGQVLNYSITTNSVSSGTLQAYARDGLTPNAGTILVSDTDIPAGQTRVLQFVAISSNVTIFLQTSVSGADFDANISVREINPLAVSIQMEGTMTYADTDTSEEVAWYRWYSDASNYIRSRVGTTGAYTGLPQFMVNSSGVFDQVTGSTTYYTPGINVPFNISSRHGSTFVNGAVDGVALTADTTPVSLPDLSSTDMQVGFDFMGTIKTLRVWADDLTDTGIEEASA